MQTAKASSYQHLLEQQNQCTLTLEFQKERYISSRDLSERISMIILFAMEALEYDQLQLMRIDSDLQRDKNFPSKTDPACK